MSVVTGLKILNYLRQRKRKQIYTKGKPTVSSAIRPLNETFLKHQRTFTGISDCIRSLSIYK